MSFYSELADLSGELIEEFGQSCTIRRPAAKEATPWEDDEATPGSPTLTDVFGVEDKKEIRDGSGSLIGRTRTVLYVAPGSITPKKSDYVAVGFKSTDTIPESAFHEIEEVKPTNPGGTDLLFELVLAD